MGALLVLTLVVVVAGSIPSQAHAEATLDDFFGNYVGGGLAERDDGSSEERDMDIAIVPYKQNGFTLNWITVIRDEAGTRTGPDVKRRAGLVGLAHIRVTGQDGLLGRVPFHAPSKRMSSNDGNSLPLDGTRG